MTVAGSFQSPAKPAVPAQKITPTAMSKVKANFSLLSISFSFPD
jgi:hypothetical protein